MKVFIRNILGALGVTVLLSQVTAMEGSFKSEIFQYDDAANAKNLHVSLKGKDWHAREVRPDDIPFYESLFSNKEIMAHFGDGKPRLPEDTKKRLETTWIPRFQNGQPHGSLTIFDAASKERIGYVAAGAGDEPAVSEIVGAGFAAYLQQGMGSDVIKQIVEAWGPEVRRIGLGKGLNESQDASVIKAFRCFGGKELNRFDATSSPANSDSWKILDKFSFKPAVSRLSNLEPVLDLKDEKFSSLEAMEKHIEKLFDAFASKPLEVGVRYRLTDPEGKLRTFSLHKTYQKIKYHFERDVE